MTTLHDTVAHAADSVRAFAHANPAAFSLLVFGGFAIATVVHGVYLAWRG